MSCKEPAATVAISALIQTHRLAFPPTAAPLESSAYTSGTFPIRYPIILKNQPSHFNFEHFETNRTLGTSLFSLPHGSYGALRFYSDTSLATSAFQLVGYSTLTTGIYRDLTLSNINAGVNDLLFLPQILVEGTFSSSGGDQALQDANAVQPNWIPGTWYSADFITINADYTLTPMGSRIMPSTSTAGVLSTLLFDRSPSHSFYLLALSGNGEGMNASVSAL